MFYSLTNKTKMYSLLIKKSTQKRLSGQTRTIAIQYDRTNVKELKTVAVDTLIDTTFDRDHKAEKLVKEYNDTVIEFNNDVVDVTELVQKYDIKPNVLIKELYKSYCNVNNKLYRVEEMRYLFDIDGSREIGAGKMSLLINEPIRTSDIANNNKFIIDTKRFNMGHRNDFFRYVFMDLLNKYIRNNATGYDSIQYDTTYYDISRLLSWSSLRDEMNVTKQDLILKASDKEYYDFIDSFVSSLTFSEYDRMLEISNMLNLYNITNEELLFVMYNTISHSIAYKGTSDVKYITPDDVTRVNELNNMMNPFDNITYPLLGINTVSLNITLRKSNTDKQYVDMFNFNNNSFDGALLLILTKLACAKINNKNVYEMKF